jgi:hypothetical protein
LVLAWRLGQVTSRQAQKKGEGYRHDKSNCAVMEGVLARGLRLLTPQAASFNNALDRTAMSAGLGVFADSRLAAALMAVGQLVR